MERLEGKMDMPLRRMEELAGMQEKVMKLKTAVVVLNETVANLSKEVAELKDKSNARDQQARGHSLRLYGLGLGEEEDNSAKFRRALLKRVYDTIVKPVLAAAKANKQLEALPSPQPSQRCNRGLLCQSGGTRAGHCWPASGASVASPSHHQVCLCPREDGVPQEQEDQPAPPDRR